MVHGLVESCETNVSGAVQCSRKERPRISDPSDEERVCVLRAVACGTTRSDRVGARCTGGRGSPQARSALPHDSTRHGERVDDSPSRAACVRGQWPDRPSPERERAADGQRMSEARRGTVARGGTRFALSSSSPAAPQRLHRSSVEPSQQSKPVSVHPQPRYQVHLRGPLACIFSPRSMFGLIVFFIITRINVYK